MQLSSQVMLGLLGIWMLGLSGSSHRSARSAQARQHEASLAVFLPAHQISE